MNQIVRVAIIQHPPVFLNLEQSLAKAISLIEEAAHNGAQLIAFPETWLPGYPVWLDEAPNAALWQHPPAHTLYQVLADNALVAPGPDLDRLLAVARRVGVHVVMGAHERAGGTLYNTMLFITDQGGYRLHRKLVPTYTERLVWGRGDGSTLTVCETESGIVGGLIGIHWSLALSAMVLLAIIVTLLAFSRGRAA